MAPVDSGELQAVLANDLGRRKRQSIPKDRSRTGAEIGVPRSVAEVLTKHVTLEVDAAGSALQRLVSKRGESSTSTDEGCAQGSHDLQRRG
jgi:hypothetical protein